MQRLTRARAERAIFEYMDAGEITGLELEPDPYADAYAARVSTRRLGQVHLLVTNDPAFGVGVEEVEFTCWPPRAR